MHSDDGLGGLFSGCVIWFGRRTEVGRERGHAGSFLFEERLVHGWDSRYINFYSMKSSSYLNLRGSYSSAKRGV